MNEFIKLLKRIRFALIPGSYGRSKYIKNHDIFYHVGEHVFWQPRILPSDPKLISLHNNIAIASNVNFINHDVMHWVFNGMETTINNSEPFQSHIGCIEIMDNVFIGGGVRILPDVKIGPNAIVAAGAVVTKDVPPETIVGGCPAKVIGNFDELKAKRLAESLEIHTKNRNLRIEPEWEKFIRKHM